MKTRKAIVIGSSMAGLLAARICSNHFDEVLIIEKDKIENEPAHRKGVPQDHQLHVLLFKGYSFLNQYFPGIIETLVQKGAIAGDLGELLKWYHEGDYRPQCETGMDSVMMSRTLLEHTVRSLLLSIPKVKMIDETKIKGLLYQNGRVTGVETDKEKISGDLVIDARGLASKLSSELEIMGYQKPAVEQVRVNVKYTSCIFPREEGFTSLVNINSNPPHNSKHGTLQPIENGRMIVMLQGRINDIQPKDINSFKAYTEELETQDIFQMIKDKEPLSDIFSYGIPFVRWIHFERLKRFPEGIIPLGDAVCRLNPVYGQGMSSAAIQAEVLDEFLEIRHKGPISKPYFKKVAKALKTPWELTVTEDFKFIGTEGTAPKIPGLLLRYFNKVNRVINQDVVIFKAFVKVVNMVAEPTTLLKPSIIWRVWRAK